EHNRVGPLPLRQYEGVLGGRGHGDSMPLLGERALQRPAHRLLIIDQKNMTHELCSKGNSIRKQVRSATLCQPMVPPCASTTCRAAGRPRPAPSGLPVTKGSNRRLATSGVGPGPLSVTSIRTDRQEVDESPSFFSPVFFRGGVISRSLTSTSPPGPA